MNKKIYQHMYVCSQNSINSHVLDEIASTY